MKSRPCIRKLAHVLALFKDGWQIGVSAHTRYSAVMCQRKLMCGGDSLSISLGAIHRLCERGDIESFRLKTDPFWLTRYRLKARGQA